MDRIADQSGRSSEVIAAITGASPGNENPRDAGRRDGGKFQTEAGGENHSNVIVLRQPIQRYVSCAGCGGPFARVSAFSTLCPTCYHWTQAALHRDLANHHRRVAEGA